MDIVVVHGSVETSCAPPYLAGLEEAALKGYREGNNDIIDLVEKTIMALEDNPLFNAGYGSVLNFDGEAEMDASIMDGTTGRCGAVAVIREVRNPVCVARKVMEESPHVLLAGEGALRFARSKGFDFFNPVSDVQRKSWEEAQKIKAEGLTVTRSPFTGLPLACDTVGSIASLKGKLAAASSTGGSFLKLPGRVGDTPVIGGGIYVTRHGAAICTGRGEAFIRCQGAAWATHLIAGGASVHQAARVVIEKLSNDGDVGGILVVDSEGNVAAVHNSASFPVALLIDGKIAADFQAKKIE